MRRHISHLLLISSIYLLFSFPALGYVGLCCGKCGGNMPMNTPGGGTPETYEYRIKFTPMLMTMNGMINGDSKFNERDLLGMPMMMGIPTGQFMAVPTEMDMDMFNISVGYSFTDDFFAGVMLMYQEKSMDMLFNSMMQMNTGEPGFTMESDGIADTMIMTKYRLYYDDPLIPKSQVSLFIGLSLPTGSIDEENSSHPVTMRQQELLPYGMQLGSGTADPTIGLLYQGSKSPIWWGVNALYTGRFYDNDRDYRLGDEVRLDLYTMYQLSYHLVSEIQLNGRYQGRIRGEMDESETGGSGHVTQGNAASPFATPLWDTDNSGGEKLGLTVGLQWQPLPLHIINLQVGAPLYQNLNGVQLKNSYHIALTWYLEIPTKKSRRYKTSGKKDSTLGF
ncbi:MAG TPA: hypothetical protein DCZ03_13025 [Gammaproteobacteria bacterium]|nr:hypothetical protein [Gammaproteobacteria bacterium]